MKSFITSVTTLTILLTLILLPGTGFAKQPLRLVYSHKVCYEPFIIARANQYFAAQGLDLEVKLVNGGIMAAESLMTGAADVAAMGDAPFLIAASRSTNVELIARYGGGSKMHRVIASNKLTDIHQLEGARVGVQMGSSTYGALLSWCEHEGLNPKKITFVSLSPLDMPQAMQSGQIDAMAGSEPWPSNVEAACGDKVHELTDFSALDNSFPLVVAAQSDVVKERRDDIQALLKALEQAVTYINQEPDQTVKTAAAVIGLPEAQQRQCTYQLEWGIGFTPQDEKSLNMTAQFLEELGKIDRAPHFSAFVTAPASQ